MAGNAARIGALANGSGEPVEQRSGHLGVAEDTVPLAEGQGRGNDCRGAFVELADQVEQELATGFSWIDLSSRPLLRERYRRYRPLPFPSGNARHAAVTSVTTPKGGVTSVTLADTDHSWANRLGVNLPGQLRTKGGHQGGRRPDQNSLLL